MTDNFDGLGWREYMRGIENGNIDPTGERLRAVCKLAREATAATPAVSEDEKWRSWREYGGIAYGEEARKAATPAVGGEREALITRLEQVKFGDSFLSCQERATIIGALAALPASPLRGVTDEMVNLACEVYAEVYHDDDKDMGDAMRATLKAVSAAAPVTERETEMLAALQAAEVAHQALINNASFENYQAIDLKATKLRQSVLSAPAKSSSGDKETP